MADPYDDDDFFDDPETLNILEAVEERAIQASQQPATNKPKPRFTQPIHHKLARPRNSPASSAGSTATSINRQKIKEPRPVNTEPGIRGTGFGWEIGGKRSFDVDRHIDNVKKREAYWGTGSNGSQRLTNVFKEEEEDEEEGLPIDVVMDGSGRYELGTRSGEIDEAVITDKRRAQPSILGESLGLAGPPPLPRLNKQSDEAIAARRRAIAAAAVPAVPAINNGHSNGKGTTPEPFNTRQPMSRSNSASASSNNGSITINPPRNIQVQQQNNGQAFGNNRSLSRSVSAGAQIFSRSNAVAGPSRLPTIPSQYSSSQNGSTNGNVSDAAPPMSQGSAARAAVIELESEKRKRQELETQLSVLQAQSAASRPLPKLEAEQHAAAGGDLDRKVRELQNQLWAAKGEAQIIRRAQREEHQRHLDELEKLKLTIQDKDVQIKEKENQAKKQMENIKHQAVFSNHAAHNSAMKVRHQSQRPPGASQSQYRPLPTPLKNGSPSRRRRGQTDEDDVPLFMSIKGKGKAPAAGPTFGGFNNAFAATPTTGPRVKRQKTADLSPQASPSRNPSPSPFQASPARSQRRSSPVVGDEAGDDGIDWGPDIQGEEVDVDGHIDQIQSKDDKAELLYHLFNHVPLSIFQITLNLTTEPSIYRLMNYRPPINVEGHQTYTQRCSDILKACGDSDMTFEGLSEIVANCLSDMLDCVSSIVSDVAKTSKTEIAVLCNIIALLSSTTLLFPSFARIIFITRTTETLKSLTRLIFSDNVKLTSYKDHLTTESKSEGEGGTEDAQSWYIELGDRIAELGEVTCFTAEGSIWKGDELVDVILGLTAPHQDNYIIRRGMELFYVASLHASNFRSLITSSETYKVSGMPNESPLIERLSRYLINPLNSASESDSLRISLLIIRGLCMLAISHSDAVILMGQRSILVPALIIVLQRESTKLYGVHGHIYSYEDALSLLLPTLSLFHHLVFPSPISSSPTNIISQSQPQSLSAREREDSDPPVGIDLPERINSASVTREFNGLQHMFVSSLGVMAYSQVSEEIISESDQRGIQYLSGDLLENVVEGPEGDAIYELYVSLDDEEGPGDDDGGEGDGDVLPSGEDIGQEEDEEDEEEGVMDIDKEQDESRWIEHDPPNNDKRDKNVIIIDDDDD
ncbi:uncharacterized protein IL334_001277 [Kwoniella shivajii]|uniref:Uncharacterized protein n=1 Tax=Kwoniella shivajii TaxID=564305 RepID=A0ABZ1CRH4_9TREE|nr:hypothetical protein IL334_001277 [Kwoniella shivajii]